MRMTPQDEARLAQAFGEIVLTAGALAKAPDTAEMRRQLYLMMERTTKASALVREIEDATRSVQIRKLEDV